MQIATDLSVAVPSGAGFADVADELARMSSPEAMSAWRNGGGGQSLGALIDALAELRQQQTADAVFDMAPRLLCETKTFTRVLASRIESSVWLPQTLFTRTESGEVMVEFDGVIEALRINLASPLVEAEVVRRRLPALVSGVQDEPRTHQPLVERTGTREYVVAPIITDGLVVGLLHADRPGHGAELSDSDRDLLRMFADGVGVCIERAALIERAERQQNILAEMWAAVSDSAPALNAAPELQLGAGSAGSQTAGGRGRIRAERPRESARLARLTSREREVLELLASGATNAQLADRLTVAESTVKSHVKHILHKLEAANRAAAISCYLRETRSEERRLR